MKHGKSKLIHLLRNVPRQGWSDQKIKDLVDSLWRIEHNPVSIDPSSVDYLSITREQVLSFFPENLPGGSGAGIEIPDITEIPAGTTNEINTVFSLSKTPMAGTLRLYLNGVRQKPGTDYALSGGTITFSDPPFAGDRLLADYKPDVAVKTRVFGEIPAGYVNGDNTTFVLAYMPVAGSERVFLNGIRQTPGADYTLTTDTIVFTTAPFTGDRLLVDYAAAITEVNRIYNETPEGDTDGVNQNFVLSQTPVSIYVYLNGVRQFAGVDYTIAGNTITFANAPFENDVILTDYEVEI